MKYRLNEKMISYENKIIAMLERVIKKQDEALKLLYEINKEPVPIITQEERERYINYVKKRLNIK